MHSPRWLVWTDVTLRPQALELLSGAGARVHSATGGPQTGLTGADAMIVGARLAGDEALFRQAPRLQVIARVGIGVDRIDVAAATRAGVCVVNTPEAPTESTAEFTIALMLAVARRLTIGAAGVAAGGWIEDARVLGFDLAGKTLGLVGCGRIGRRVAEIAGALHMRVVAYDPYAAEWPESVQRVVSLDELLPVADVISLHAPATAETRHLLGARQLEQCKTGAVVINAARGPLIDEVALLAALETGKIRGAGLDVWDPEPPRVDHPLRTHPRVVATPHMAAFTEEGKERSHDAAARQVLEVLAGQQPASLVNPVVWPKRRCPEPPKVW